MTWSNDISELFWITSRYRFELNCYLKSLIQGLFSAYAGRL